MPVSVVMTARDVVEILGWLGGGDVEVWLDGGWGVDALVGGETRAHKDLDLIVLDDHALQLRGLLSRHGFEHARGPDWNFVLRDHRGREVDVHPVRAVHHLLDPRTMSYRRRPVGLRNLPVRPLVG